MQVRSRTMTNDLSQQKTCLVTGVAGFIGSHLAEALDKPEQHQDKSDPKIARSIFRLALLVVPILPPNEEEQDTEAKDNHAQGYVSLMRNLVKSSGIYALASVASPLV